MKALKRLSYLILPLPLAATAALADDKSIRIGYAQCAALAEAPSALPDKAARLKWYFAHASVGANMMDGLADLGKSNSAAYPFTIVSGGEKPPPQTQPGAVYQHNRGNPGWQAKFDQFESCVSNGWHAPNVDIVMNKLCYIDQMASFKYYVRSMTNLEAAFPETVFVYMTMPITTATDAENALRNGFNERVREWTRANGRVLFDLADIESHDPKGQPSSFTHRNKTYQRLWSGYTDDGGHLNEISRQLVARGFYALAKALEERNSKSPALNAVQQLRATREPRE